MIQFRMIRKSLNSLAGKLIIAVGTLITLGSLLFGFTFMRYEENIMMNNLMSYAASTADLVKKGINYYMMTAHREAIEQTVEVIGSGAEIKGISILDKSGKVIYSSRKSEVGRSFDKSSVTCQLCHRHDTPIASIANARNWAILSDAAGVKVLKFVIPIYNEPSCYTASCHYHRKETKYPRDPRNEFQYRDGRYRHTSEPSRHHRVRRSLYCHDIPLSFYHTL